MTKTYHATISLQTRQEMALDLDQVREELEGILRKHSGPQPFLKIILLQIEES